ncbi:hypothetical protein N7470_002668 [Penicillium chermesinum]|nr:hypothetical protein N7470_002668 [Penicillium chermesinum]
MVDAGQSRRASERRVHNAVAGFFAELHILDANRLDEDAPVSLLTLRRDHAPRGRASWPCEMKTGPRLV